MPVDAINGELFSRSFAAYHHWKTTWVSPAVRAVDRHSFEEATARLEAARTELEHSGLADDVREALGYLFLYMHCRINWHPDCLGYTQQDYDAMLARFRPPALSELGDCIRRNLLLLIRCNGTFDSYDTLTLAEVEELLEPLPDRLAGPAWQQLARWAFERGEAGILARAYEAFLEYPGSLSQAKWQRVNLMHRLMNRTATSRDVLDYLSLLNLRPQLREFRNEFLPLCHEQGLVDADVAELLAEREAAVGMG